MAKNYKYIYGPVSSWRLGLSLGVDLLSEEKKICSFDCLYCQVGQDASYETERKIYAPTEEVIKELKGFSKTKIDYITFSGRGEPTLAKNLGDVIKEIRKIRTEPIAILTNSSLIDRADVVEDLRRADFVMAKLDAFSPESFKSINKPGAIKFESVLRGLKAFRRKFKKKFALQIMFINENKFKASELAALSRQINPDEIQINTPLRECPSKPLSGKEINDIMKHFKGMNVISVYDYQQKAA